MRYDICIFDVDGTLTDPLEGIVNAFRYALEKLGIDEEPENPERFVGPPLKQSFIEYYGFSDDEAANAVEIFRKYYKEKGLYENELYPGIVDLLQSLKSEGAVLAVATSKFIKFGEEVLNHFDLRKYFDFVSGDAYDGSKSRGGKHEIVSIALDAVDPLRAKRAVMIGDRHHDILGGLKAGTDSIGVLWGYGSREEFEKAGATWIAETPADLQRFLA